MSGVTVVEANRSLHQLIDEAAVTHQPIVITGKRNNAVLISEEDWSSIQETLFLLSVPKMRDSICKGMDTPISECDEDLES
ncbi:type II toxin-antitoxin system Phd/YefM family antitoxin [Marinomonas sp. A79]|uniref:Antitoxin n=1 Tax=Marinomonas vulgaris TaxID=2823372 RepID=A0ABS5H7A3_9GAMM|nr:type II toxin-antitoxin system Phd/YefM family antitoxin [Marinomonas vulgaris]MBR7887591.1 type II toxin-antitoxin system Phd/YefM family antitoxin [Marinomonas vulgaris]